MSQAPLDLAIRLDNDTWTSTEVNGLLVMPESVKLDVVRALRSNRYECAGWDQMVQDRAAQLTAFINH